MKLVDESTDIFKVSTLLAQVNYVLIIMVNVERQIDSCL